MSEQSGMDCHNRSHGQIRVPPVSVLTFVSQLNNPGAVNPHHDYKMQNLAYS